MNRWRTIPIGISLALPACAAAPIAGDPPGFPAYAMLGLALVILAALSRRGAA